jgi:hypothetical protein
MDALIISGSSKKDLQLLANIAEKMGLTFLFVKESDLEDMSMARAIIEGKTGELVDTNEFLKML